MQGARACPGAADAAHGDSEEGGGHEGSAAAEGPVGEKVEEPVAAAEGPTGACQGPAEEPAENGAAGGGSGWWARAGHGEPACHGVRDHLGPSEDIDLLALKNNEVFLNFQSSS